MRLDDLVFVLARPSEPGNVGAVCRAIKNMGFRHLRIATSELAAGSARSESIDRLLARAIHAADVWENAEHFGTLQEALADCALSVGTSRRRGRHRKSNSMTPRELAAFLKGRIGKTAIVFGHERTGLEKEELDLCNMASHIPVAPEFPSINLSHAVQIYAYELYQTLAHSSDLIEGPDPVSGQWVPMTTAEIDAQVGGLSRALASLGFYKYPGREEQERFLRDIMARAGLSLNEGRYLSKIIAKANRLS